MRESHAMALKGSNIKLLECPDDEIQVSTDMFTSVVSSEEFATAAGKVLNSYIIFKDEEVLPSVDINEVLKSGKTPGEHFYDALLAISKYEATVKYLDRKKEEDTFRGLRRDRLAMEKYFEDFEVLAEGTKELIDMVIDYEWAENEAKRNG